MVKLKPIRSEREYESALLKMESILHAKRHTPDGDFLEVLSLLVHEQEQKKYKIELLTPLEALRYEMQEKGINQSSLAKRFGMSKGTISEILNGHKQMSVRFMKFLHHELGIPAQILLA